MEPQRVLPNSLLLLRVRFRGQHTQRVSLKHQRIRSTETSPRVRLLPPARMKFQERASSRRGSRKDSPLSSREFLRSIQVQLSYFFGCLNYTIGILYVYQPFHSFALLLRFKNKREVKKLSHTQHRALSEPIKYTATHPKSRIQGVFTTRQQNHL